MDKGDDAGAHPECTAGALTLLGPKDEVTVIGWGPNCYDFQNLGAMRLGEQKMIDVLPDGGKYSTIEFPMFITASARRPAGLAVTVVLPTPPLVETTDTTRTTSALLRQTFADPLLDLQRVPADCAQTNAFGLRKFTFFHQFVYVRALDSGFRSTSSRRYMTFDQKLRCFSNE
jgi:hypothetical protein